MSLKLIDGKWILRCQEGNCSSQLAIDAKSCAGDEDIAKAKWRRHPQSGKITCPKPHIALQPATALR